MPISFTVTTVTRSSGAATIAGNFATRVPGFGIRYTEDQLLIDADRCAVALEWTMFMQKPITLVRRGLEWYVFEPQTWRIQEIRGYTAAPLDSGMARQELLDFDYAERGYPTAYPPAVKQ
jgi:methyltransferase